jgi:hypothetical protein
MKKILLIVLVGMFLLPVVAESKDYVLPKGTMIFANLQEATEAARISRYDKRGGDDYVGTLVDTNRAVKVAYEVKVKIIDRCSYCREVTGKDIVKISYTHESKFFSVYVHLEDLK